METLCIHQKWLVEVWPGEWAHEDDMLSCVPEEHFPVIYLDEIAEVDS
jgi:hypothetical protein